MFVFCIYLISSKGIYIFGYCCVLIVSEFVSQVALHLLSQKDKNDLAQLVSTMVSYSVTYKNVKSSPLSSNQEYEATLDASALSFDPPICDFINFKVFFFLNFTMNIWFQYLTLFLCNFFWK